MKQHKLFNRFFLVAIWLGMVNLSSLQAQEVYFFEDFETGGGDLFSPQDRMMPPEGWKSNVFSPNTNSHEEERFYFTDNLNDVYYPDYPIEGKFAVYSSFGIPYTSTPDSTSIESPFFTLPQENVPIILSFDHQFKYTNDTGNGIVQIWDGAKWIIVYEVGFQTIGYNSDVTIRTVISEQVDITNWIVNLSQTKIRLTFYQEAGSNSKLSWWLIDNLKVSKATTVDIRTTALNHTTLPYHCYTSHENFQVQIQNYGTTPIDFSERALTLYVQTTGVLEQIYSQKVEQGSLGINETQTVTVENIDLSQTGEYVIQAYPQLEGDENTKHDTTYLYRTHVTPLTVPLPNFDFDVSAIEAAEEMGWNIPNLWYFSGDFEHPNGFAASRKFDTEGERTVLTLPKIKAISPMSLVFDLAFVQQLEDTAPANTMGGNTQLQLRVSTDCGQTFTTIDALSSNYHIAARGQRERFYIEGYNEQEIILSLVLAYDNPEASEEWRLYIDNISMETVLARDIGVLPTNGFISGNYSPDITIEDNWWVCGDTHFPVSIQLQNYGAMLQNNFEVVATAANETFSVIVNEALYPNEKRELFLGTVNTYSGGQFDLEAYIKLPNDDNHSNDTLNAFWISLPSRPYADFFYEDKGNGTLQFQKAYFPGNAQYEWDFGDGKGSSTFRNPSYTYEENGTYEVMLIVTDDCGSSSHTEMVVVDTVVGIEDIDLEQILSITPSPLNGNFAVKIEGRVIPTAHIQVFTANGQLVFQKNYTNFQETMISLNKYSSGLYFLQFATPSDIISLSFFHQ